MGSVGGYSGGVFNSVFKYHASQASRRNGGKCEAHQILVLLIHFDFERGAWQAIRGGLGQIFQLHIQDSSVRRTSPVSGGVCRLAAAMRRGQARVRRGFPGAGEVVRATRESRLQVHMAIWQTNRTGWSPSPGMVER